MRRSGFPVFFRLAWRTVFQSKGTFARLTPKRAMIMGIWMPMIFFTQLIHHIGFFLDDIFFPGWKETEVEKPLFIVGIPRSGTTFLHRLISEDVGNFTTLTTWEMVLAPSVTERKFFLLIGAIDRLLGGFGKKLVHKVEDRVFASVRKIHKIGLFEPEEDDIILFPIFASIFLLFPFPFQDEMDINARFDELMPPEDKKAIMSFYRGCVQKHLYVNGTDKRFLSKNPMFTSKIDSLFEYFPTAQILCNVRNPYQAVPSLLSFVSQSWDRFDNDKKGQDFYRMMFDIVAYWYKWPMKRLPEYPAENARFVTYDQLTQDLEPTIHDLYEWLDLEFGPRWKETFALEVKKAKAYKSKHTYDLSTYGLDYAQINEALGGVFEQFGFEQLDASATDDA